MAGEHWPCAACHSLNLPSVSRCYSCRAPRVADASGGPAGAAPVAPGRRFRGRVVALVVAMTVTVGVAAAVVAFRPQPGQPQGQPAAAVAGSPSPSIGTPSPGPDATGTARATPRPSADPPSATPAPSTTPAPSASPAEFTPFLGRLSGTWLLIEVLDQEATGAGAYPSELLLRVRPACAEGACAVSASLVNPRNGKVVASARVKPTAAGYRISLKASTVDLCRGTDGRTVQGGATRTTSYVLRPFTSASAGGATVLAAEATIRLNPNRRGDSVGCRDGRYPVSIEPAKLSKADLASVKDGLTPVPLPNLVPRPTGVAGIKGVRLVTYPVKGSGATQLQDRWAAASSRKRYCGKVQYPWHTGSRQTLACIKSTIEYGWTYRQSASTGSCTITGFTLRIPMTFTIARWSGPALVARDLARWWKAMQRHVRDHEAGHVAINRKWAPILRKRIVGRPCESAESIVTKWSRQLNAAQEAYDKREYARTDWPAWPSDAP